MKVSGKDTALVAAQPRMAIAPGDDRNRKQLTDRTEDGVIVERREAIQMPTVERERLFAPGALREWPMPAIKGRIYGCRRVKQFNLT